MEKPTLNDHPIIEPLRQRWSPVAFDPRPVPTEKLLSLFEAARWSASCFGEQPWRFIVGVKDTDPATFEKLASTLAAGNAWAKEVPVLILGIAKKTFDYNGSENRFAAYDVGQAVGQLSVQAASDGLFLHQMGGFDAAMAQEIFAIPENFAPMAMIALGYLGDAALLADEKQRERHNNPKRVRKPLAELVFTEWEKPAL